MRRLPPGLRRVLAGTPLALLAAACASHPEPDPRYKPAESVLEVVAVLRAHVPDDTYRFEAARDFTGRNVYRSSLLRLESLERVHADALAAGHLDGVIAFSKGRSLERLRAFELAAAEYRHAAERDQALADEASASATVCDALEAAARMGTGAEGGPDYEDPDAAQLADVVARFDARSARLEALAEQVSGTHYPPVVREELERADVERAEYFLALRSAIPDGDVRASAELQRVIARNRDSKLVSRHLLALAGFYEELAEEYVEANPPEGLLFDPVRFQELVDAASRLYETVAQQDGKPEKLEASRKLEAFLAFALRVDHDRFTP